MVEGGCRSADGVLAMAGHASSSLKPLGLQTWASHGRTGCPPEARIGSLSISCSARSVLACVGPGGRGKLTGRRRRGPTNGRFACVQSRHPGHPSQPHKLRCSQVTRLLQSTAVDLTEYFSACFVWAHGPPKICIAGEFKVQPGRNPTSNGAAQTLRSASTRCSSRQVAKALRPATTSTPAAA